MNSNKNSLIIIFILVVIIGIVLFFMFGNNGTQNNNIEDNTANNVARLAAEGNILGNNENLDEVNNRIENIVSEAHNHIREEEVASYSTNLSGSSEGRLTNVRITCEKLNGTIVSVGDTFSFCDIVGECTSEKGYQEAPVIINGETVQALGGGNCQVSSTLYNAVLAVTDLEVIERHEHGKQVHYVPEGKDAAVSYGSVDFKFKNNTPNDIKLYFSTDDETISATIVKLI